MVLVAEVSKYQKAIEEVDQILQEVLKLSQPLYVYNKEKVIRLGSNVIQWHLANERKE